MSDGRERLLAQLLRIRELSGLSLRALAQKAGLSSSSLSRYLTGRLVPPWDAVVALCRVVGRDPRPLRPLWAEASQTAPAPAPRRNDLPADVADFTAREREIARAEELVRNSGAVAVDGMAGVGKTALAVHVAHRLAAAYPDGGIYLDLHGFTPGHDPLEPATALARLLAALGVDRLPGDPADRAALWRSELSGRRALIVLDNAADAGQVRPLLPGAGKSAVIVTSRNRLVSLDTVPPLSLAPLSAEDSVALFGRAAGVAPAADDAIAQVLGQCGGLPLALRMAGARLRHRPGWTVAVLAERLRDTPGRFDAVFGMSLHQLDTEQRRTFRLLGVVPGEDFDAAVVAALTGLPPGRVGEVLDELVDAHLVQEPSPGRFRQHDLIRRYASDLAADEEPQREAAVRRVLDHYVGRAVAYDRMLPFVERDRPAEGDPATAMAWFDAEYANLLSCFEAALRTGADDVVTALPPAMLAWFFRRRGTDEKVRLFEAAVAAAERLGDRPRRAALLTDLGFALAAAGRPADALATYERAQAAGPERPDLALRIGYLRLDLGELAEARTQFRRARALFAEAGHRAGQSQALAFDGWATLHLGEDAEAAGLARESIALADGPPQITGLVTLGVALAGTQPAEALAVLGDALRLAEADDHLHNQAWCHNYLGVALRIIGEPGPALAHHRRAFELIDLLGEPQWEIDFLATYAETQRVAGHPDEARALYARMIELARDLGRPFDEQRARDAYEAVVPDGRPRSSE
ncbi:ATP-binding protein [Hamadaea tsunoensis]|uniref:ATP-binding protein n=1 Tax=Hamadaea tsunoensis TaxID=53368 RepID=UPI0005574767|nr:helix-turn-helix domain-containing protein [Hamadaea tsunoensis]